jgi:hypothetical protein
MRRIAIIMAGAALALSLVVPAAVVAEAHGRGGHRGDRHGYSYGHRGGSCYGCWGPGSRCDRHGCDYAFYGYYGYPGYYGYGGYYGGYWPGGFGCNFDYPCGPPYEFNCSKYTGRDGMKPPAESGCKYDQKCDCYYHSSQPPQAGAQPAPAQGAQPAPDQGAPPPADQGMQPAPGHGGEQPRPY